MYQVATTGQAPLSKWGCSTQTQMTTRKIGQLPHPDLPPGCYTSSKRCGMLAFQKKDHHGKEIAHSAGRGLGAHTLLDAGARRARPGYVWPTGTDQTQHHHGTGPGATGAGDA